MLGNHEAVSTFKSDAATTQIATEDKGQHITQRLFDDTDLSSLKNRPAQNERVGALGGTGESSAVTSTATPADAARPVEAKPDGQSDVKDQLVTEDEFMIYAPNLYRHQLRLPGNATSKTFVDKYMVDNFEHENKQLQGLTLKLLDVDEKTSRDILGHNPGSEKKLADILLQKEKEFLEIPPELKEDQSYKKIEDGILHNNYRAQIDIEKLRRLMEEP